MDDRAHVAPGQVAPGGGPEGSNGTQCGAASADDERSETVSDVAKRQIIPGGFGARSPATTPTPELPLRRYSLPRIHPLNNLPALILIACLLACFLGVVQSERSLLGGDSSLNYQESTELFTAQQEVL